MTDSEIAELIEFKNKNVGKWAFPVDQDPCALLTRFWQRSSDACPLEANEAEKQENEFHDWLIGQAEQLEFPVEK
jgi:hypothetical protein